MSNPTTPTKRGDRINEIAEELGAKWGLQLPIKNAPYSPSKVPNPDSEGEQILRRIRYLFWKDSDGLQRALARFDQHAQHIFSEWRFKPNAETDVLPSRGLSRSILQGDSFLKRKEISEPMVVSLSSALLRFLVQEQGPIPNDEPRPLSNNDQIVESSMEINPPKAQSKLSRFFTTVASRVSGAKPTPNESEHASSDDFKPDQETAGFFTDITMEDVFYETTAKPEVTRNLESAIPKPCLAVSDQVDSNTLSDAPLDSSYDASEILPELMSSFHIDAATDLYLLQRPDMIPLPKQPSIRKRSCPEPSMPSISRKMSRDAESPRSPLMYPVNHLVPLSFKSPESLMSMTNSTTASSTRTTPNTSFYTESAATSFNSSIGAMPGHLPNPANKLDQDGLTNNYDSMELDSISNGKQSRVMGPPEVPVPRQVSANGSSRISDYLKAHLYHESPFALVEPSTRFSVSFRQVYEVVRVASSCKLPLLEFAPMLQRECTDYNELWHSLSGSIHNQGREMPERSSLAAWKRAEGSFDGVTLTGDLIFDAHYGSPLFKFQLKALKGGMSYRLSRKFGGDRFCIVGLPGIAKHDLPDHLRQDAVTVRTLVLHWLIETDHRFLGRIWRAFYLKPQDSKHGKESPNIKHRVYLFATGGHDFISLKHAALQYGGTSGTHTPMTVNELINWFMPAKMNGGQPVMKFFARLALAVSNTIPTIQFRSNEIIRSDDAYADAPAERSLDVKRHEEKKKGVKAKTSAGAIVMNDGCARISRAASVAIAAILRLSGQIPCAYQGRIGSAKGMWFVDAKGESLSSSERGFWIEITDSQLKFEGHPIDDLYPDAARLTFEVRAWSRPLIPTSLNFQLIPILTDRGVPKQVFMNLLEEDLTTKVANLQAAMDSPLGLRKWNQEDMSVMTDRIKSDGIEMLGGLPNSRSEIINWALEHGFIPKTCRFLRDVCYKSMSHYCQRLEERMKVGVGRSCYAFMIADPLAVLEENEVHVGFSTAFRDDKSGFSDTLLNDMNLLVARMPAVLPSDVQKVRAVFRPELGMYKDVIVFPSKGRFCLAHKLSGGDYDGDIAWICWDQSIVEPFCNAEVHAAPTHEYYGIMKDETKVADIDKGNFASQFLHMGFDFNLEESLLGICTSYFESLCYKHKSINDPTAKNIAALLGHLVDRAKGGLRFTSGTWEKFKQKNGLKPLPRPAYKTKEEPLRISHIIDELVFTVAKGIREKALGQFSTQFESAPTRDVDLVKLYKAEDGEAAKDEGLKNCLDDLQRRFIEYYSFWRKHCTGDQDDEAKSMTKNGSMGFRKGVEALREKFLNIEPVAGTGSAIVERWRKEFFGNTMGASSDAAVGAEMCHWTLLKASTLFHYYRVGSFPWYVAGKELGELKLRALGGGHSVTQELYLAYKLDTGYVKRIYAVREGATDDGLEIGAVGGEPFEATDDGEGEGAERWGYEVMVDAIGAIGLDDD